jgi:hypothetical protein
VYYDAEARGQAHLLAILEGECRGGAQVTTVVERYNGNGDLIERQTKTETARPDAASIRWRLERRYPELWGRQRIEVTGPDGGPVEVTGAERADRLAAALTQVRSALSDNGHEPALN